VTSAVKNTGVPAGRLYVTLKLSEPPTGLTICLLRSTPPDLAARAMRPLTPFGTEAVWVTWTGPPGAIQGVGGLWMRGDTKLTGPVKAVE
jgi:hypothetical protein